jgi:hypothetical protein
VLCWQGEVLAGISVEAVETTHATGPSTVVRVIDQPEMKSVAEKLVRQLNLSGFCGFDFVIDHASGKPYLIELNPRPTPSCHLALNSETDMVCALFAKLAGAQPRRSPKRDVPELIAYFPQELWRNRSSTYFRTAFHDVPWEEPDFVEMYFRPHHGDWIVQLAMAARRLWPDVLAGKFFPSLTVAKDH